MKNENIKTKKVLDIISYVGVFIFFILALICAIFKFQGAKFTIFGNRYDVVLTNSMASKNEKYASFLEGHDNQFNAFDVVKSVPINSPDDLHVYDIVVYTDRYIGTNTHRIVDIETNYEEKITFEKSSLVTLGGVQGVSMYNIASQVSANDIEFTELEFTVYSELEETDNFHFNILNKQYTPEVTQTPSNGGYLVTYKVTRNTKAPGKTIISHKREYDYSKEVVKSLKINSSNGNIVVDPTTLIMDGENLYKGYNKQVRYEIRGDAAPNSDGWYTYKELQAKVTNIIPKVGYLVRFLGSTWGGIMFALLGFLILIVDVISDRMDKKEKAVASGVTEKKTKTKKNNYVLYSDVNKEKPKDKEQGGNE